MFSTLRMSACAGAFLCAMGLPSAVMATPITSNSLSPDATVVNTSTFAEGLTTISTSGLTVTGGFNDPNDPFAFPGTDLSYVDTDYPLQLTFTPPAHAFGFDFVTAVTDSLTLTAYSATNQVLEQDTFSLSGLPTLYGLYTGYIGMTDVSGIDHVVLTDDYTYGGVYIGTVTYEAPEPASLALVGTGLVGFVMARRRKALL